MADAKTPKRCLPLPEAIRAEMERIDPGAYNAEAIARDVVGMCRKLFAEDSTQALGVVALLRDTAYGRPSQAIHQTGTIRVELQYDDEASALSAPARVAAGRAELEASLANGSAPSGDVRPTDRENGKRP